MILLVSFFLLIGVLVALFLGVILPIWTIIDCANSQKTQTQKIVWIVCMIIFGMFASLIYVIKCSQNKTLRALTFGTFCCAFLLAFGIVKATLKLSNHALRQIQKVDLQFENYAKELTAQQSQDLKMILDEVKNHLKKPEWIHLGRHFDYVDTAELYYSVTRDQSISEIDYMDIKEMLQTIDSKGSKITQEILNKYRLKINQK